MGQSEVTLAVLTVAIIILIGATGFIMGVQADSPLSNESVVDIDQDGDVDALLLNMSKFINGTSGSVVVFDRADHMTRSDTLRAHLSYTDELIVYDVENDGKAELVVEFNKRADRVAYPWRALIYTGGKEGIEYNMSVEGLDLGLEKTDPEVKMSSTERWVTTRGVSYNLKIKCNSKVRCSFGGGEEVTIIVNDSNSDNIPDYEIRNINSGKHPTELIVNTGREEILKSDSGVIFPFIGATSDNGYNKGKPPQPPVQIDWKNGTVQTVGEFLASRGAEDNYFVYTRGNSLSKKKVNNPSFEFPFSFHDLAKDDDNVPELAVRIVAYSKGNPYALGIYPSRLPFDVAWARYSWDQDNDGRWDYKLGLVGRNSYTNIDTVGPFQLRKPVYNQTPDWVINNKWKAVSFVAAAGGTKGSEGIYTGDFDQEYHRQIFGLTENESMVFTQPSRGFRMELNTQYGNKPRLYYSGVDNRLHLLNLSKGYWNKSGANIEYRNTDSDPFIDHWKKRTPEGKRHLIAEQDELVYANDSTLSVKRTSIVHSEFVAEPPTTSQEWDSLKERTGGNTSAATNLSSIFSGVNSSTVSLREAAFTGYVPTEDGFYIFANISKRSQIEGPSSATLPDASQVVLVFREGTEEIEINRLTPPSLSITNVSTASESISLFEQNKLSIAIKNHGWDTADNVRIQLEQGGKIVQTKSITVTGKHSTVTTLSWWPRTKATEATLTIETEAGRQIKRKLSLNITGGESLSIAERYRIGNRNPYLAIGMGLIVIIGVILGVRESL